MSKSRKKVAATEPAPRPRTPMPIRVEEDEDQTPLAVTCEGVSLKVVSIEERVESEEGWWDDNPTVHMHYDVLLDNGRQLTIFRNMMHGGWSYHP